MKKLAIALLILTMSVPMIGCREAKRVSYNVSKEADNFNVIRRLAVINSRTDKVEFEIIGNFSLQTEKENQICVVCETGKNEYKKHIVGLNDETMYVIEDLYGAEVDKYKYEVNYLPEMIQPIAITSNK